jgi:multiple sugar transport system permease protein
MSRHAFEERFFRIARWVSIVFFVCLTGFPLLVMLGLSFRPVSSLLNEPGRLLPRFSEIDLDGYTRILSSREDGGFGFAGFIGNSAYIAGVTVVCSLSFGILAAYAATRLRYRGASFINASIIMVYLFPPLVFAVPLFVMFTRLGMRPSFTAVIIIYFAYTLPLALYMLRNYFSSVPVDIEEAARIDGASRFGVIRHVIVPLSAPAIATVGIYVFMSAWDEFLFALLFLVEDRDSWTVALGINQLEANVGTPTTVLMAGCVVITIPVVVAFSLVQRFLTEGLTSGSVKD